MRLIDLTHPLKSGMAPFPGDPDFAIEPHLVIEADGCTVSRLTMGSHTGTHLDAPAHIFEGGLSVERLSLEWLYGDAALLRIPKAAKEEIDTGDLLPFEGSLTAGSRIVVETGWHREFGSERFFTDHPSLTLGAARYLASRRIRLLGLDTPSPSREWQEVHQILLGHGVVIVESLANLDQVPERFVLSALPLRLAGCDGSPLRAVAIVSIRSTSR